ncbi:MAG TPA: 1,4-dihydroxy-2-naphthoate octaprenyltransferase [Candidatus Binataceae bacterium]|nr:1,4-dihydroxy-2-naphthoate octaprenyltransferase [Candidatus Binataceae bacterium]
MAEAGAIPHGGGAKPGAIAVWLRAIRAPSLSAAAIPVLLGAAVAVRDGFFAPGRLILALVGSMAIQAGTNLINDYYDYLSGADSEQSLGPSMAIQRGLLSPDQVWRGGIIALGIGSALGLVLVYLCGWPILLLGIPSVAAGYFYTANPVALAYVAMGELTVFIFMGPVIVMGAYYVMALQFSWTAWWASVPLGLLVTGILHANNLRDIESDRRHGKRTLATILGRTSAIYELAALDIAAYAATFGAALAHALPWTTIAAIVTVPRAIDQVRIAMRETEPKRLNRALMRSVQLHMEFGLLMTAAFLLAALFGR